MTRHQTIHATFAALAGRMAEQVAVVCGDEQLTYRELDERSSRVAAYLQSHGVSRGDRVGLYCHRSVEAVVAMLATLKAGAAYVPFDPTYPAKLLKFVYEDCAPVLMLVEAALQGDGAASFWSGPHHDIRCAGGGKLLAMPADADDAAYIMYTSGSTGHPKGVVVPHRGVVRLVIDNPFAMMGPEQVHLQLAPLAFDASTFEIWGALLNGGQLAVLPLPHASLDDIAQSLARHRVTTLWLTAGLFHLMVDHRLQGLKPLRQLIAGGDVLSPSHVAKAYAGLPECQLINGYGPTENTTFTCCYRIPRDAAPGPVPIGVPIAHTEVYVLDESRNPVRDGEEGELYAGGAGVALGYLNREELTAERFVADPFVPAEANPLAPADANPLAPHGAKMYRSGDRVRRRADGNIEFLGRVDRQVKINGKRVELDEIEATLRRCPRVEDAAVTSPSGGDGPRKVHAYVKFNCADDSSNIKELRDFLKRETADYMMPATFTVMHALPLSPTGKIDRSQLPAPVENLPSAPAAAAGNEIENRLMEIWCRVLGRTVGADDNFFDLGGTSLQLIQVHATIASAMQTDVTVVDLFQYPRVSALAARIARHETSAIRRGAAVDGKAADAGILSAAERALRQQAAVARARANPRRTAR